MTTRRLTLEEIFSDQPDSSDGGSRPPRRRRRGWGEAAERADLRWTVLLWVIVLAALIRRIGIPHRVALLQASSYKGATTTAGNRCRVSARARPRVTRAGKVTGTRV